MRYVFRKITRKILAKYAVVKLMPTVRRSILEQVEEKILAFGNLEQDICIDEHLLE